MFAHRPLLALRPPQLFSPEVSPAGSLRRLPGMLRLLPFRLLPSAELELELELSCPLVIGAGNL